MLLLKYNFLCQICMCGCIYIYIYTHTYIIPFFKVPLRIIYREMMWAQKMHLFDIWTLNVNFMSKDNISSNSLTSLKSNVSNYHLCVSYLIYTQKIIYWTNISIGTLIRFSELRIVNKTFNLAEWNRELYIIFE